jgi:ribosomal protein L37AE/L43A
MLALLTSSLALPRGLINGRKLRTINPTTNQSMSARETCLCCSNSLVRHIRLGGIYWRCSHCYQEMPI